MKILSTLIVFFGSFQILQAQSKEDVKRIELLCGCFDVEFKYAETFAPDEEYEYHNRERINWAREIVIPIEKSNKKISLQHLLVMDDTVIIKHWREDWSYENPELLMYDGDYSWKKVKVEPAQYKKKWTQTVWEVSDAPRYQGVSEWVSTDGKTFWMNTTDAPLPRREYTKRKDYNVLKRRNLIYITPDGWVHEQDNQKVIRRNGVDTLLAEEKGMNTYKRVDDSKCLQGKLYWEKNKEYWSNVRNAWDKLLSAYPVINIKPQVDGKPLHEYLSEIEDQYASKQITLAETNQKIQETLQHFIADRKIELSNR
ncbi:MAG: hypothetical protein JNK79_18005 [Chitinophagaceae bacterium]|nr:hypothetical protein [Chitinophagaceae bacterium]